MPRKLLLPHFRLLTLYAVGAAAEGGAGTTASATPSFTKSFNSLLGLKKGIFLAGTSTFSPVLGLRPIRGLRWRVRKLPKPSISILSPARKDRTTLSKIVSTITSLSLRVSSAKRETSSIRSAFVIVPLRSQPALPGKSSLGGDGFGSESATSHNLLKFQGLYASLSFGTTIRWRFGLIFETPIPGRPTSTDSRTPPAAPASSRGQGSTGRHRRSASRA